MKFHAVRFFIPVFVIILAVNLSACAPAISGEFSNSDTTTVSTAPSGKSTISTSMSSSPVNGDESWGMYNGKVFVRSEDTNSEQLLARLIKLYTDGTFYSNQSVASSNGPVQGTWKWEDGILSLLWSGAVQQQQTENISQFRYKEGILTFIKGANDISSMRDIPDGTQFIFKGVIKYEENK